MPDARSPMLNSAKLQAPRLRPEMIVRERLTRLLSLASERPLTVLCAPAGYGKTTALVTWLESEPRPHAWVSLDARDDDPRRFGAHLVAALDRIWPGAMVEAERALSGGSDVVETVVPLVVAALEEHAGEDGVVVVFDDVHTVTAADAQRVLRDLVDALPDGVRVVLSSRAKPPLRLGRRKVTATALEIGPDQLAFRGAESELLLNGALDLGLDAAQIATIDGRVDGWAAGLALIAASLGDGGGGGGDDGGAAGGGAGGRSGSGSTAPRDRDAFLHAFARSGGAVEEYLMEEVLSGLPERMQAFLFRTSVLERLSPSLCQAVLDDPGAAGLLDEVRRSNLFVTVLDGEWVRYHHLFAELLVRQLQRATPELLPVLHLRAAEWCAANGLPDDAIRHATAAGDGRRAAELLREHWRVLFYERRYATLRRLIAEMPADRGDLAAFCQAVEVRCMGLDDVDLRIVAQRLDALEAVREQPGVGPAIDHMRVSPYYGDVGRALGDAWTAWERYPDPAVRTELVGNLAVVLWFAGDRAAVYRVVEPYLGVIDRPRPLGWALAALALCAADDGDLELAEGHARDAVEVFERHGSSGALESHFAYVALAEALRLRGELNEAAVHLGHAARLTGKRRGSPFQAITLVLGAQLELAAGDRGAARASALAARAIFDRNVDLGVLAARLEAVEQALEQPSPKATEPGSQPSPSEQRVLTLLPTEMTNHQIAERLYLSEHTVRTHIRKLYRRLGAHDRDEAVSVARERGLL